MLDKGWGSPKVTKDGVTVAEDIDLDDSYENLGAQLVKEAASKTNDVAGDGTTTATVFGEAIFREGLKMIAGHDAILLGAVGFPDVPDHVSLWGLLIPIRRQSYFLPMVVTCASRICRPVTDCS